MKNTYNFPIYGNPADAFKEETNWTEDELSSLLVYLEFLAASDGKIDDEEKQTIERIILTLPGNKPLNWQELYKKTDELLASFNMPGQSKSIEILQNMHLNKRKKVIYFLYNLADADGKIDDIEKEIFVNLSNALFVNSEEQKLIYEDKKKKTISQESLFEPLSEYLKERPNTERIYNELIASVKNGYTIDRYLIEANLLNSNDENAELTMYVVSRSFSDISNFLEKIFEQCEDNEIRDNINIINQSIEILNTDSIYGELINNLKNLKPCIANAEFWNDILDKRAQSRIMFKSLLQETDFNESMKAHKQEYILRFEDNNLDIQGLYDRIDVYHMFIEQYEIFFRRYQEHSLDIPEEIENKFFALIESLAGAELTLLDIKFNHNEMIDKEKIYNNKERPNNAVVEDYENDSNTHLIDKNIFTYYKGYLFNGTIIFYQNDFKYEMSMRYGLKHGSYKKFDKDDKIILDTLAFNDIVFPSNFLED